MPTSENIADPMSDNEALREILGEVRLLDSAIRQPYVSLAPPENNQPVTAEEPYVRAANANAVKTVVTNIGAADVRVFEDGALVAILSNRDTWESPLSGAGEITVTTETESAVAVATYLKE